MKPLQHKSIPLFMLFFVLLTSLVQAQQPTGLHLLKKTVVGGEGWWDYLTPDHTKGRLYLSHGTQVEVLELTTHKKIGVIAGTSGVHGIAVVHKAGHGFITCGRTNSVALFDLKTLKITKQVPAGTNPDALLYDAFSDRVFVFNKESKNATVLDATSGKVLGIVELGGNPEAGVSDEKGQVFINIEDTAEIVVLNAKTLKVEKRFPLTPGEEPTGIALDRKNGRLFSACGNQKMMVLDAVKGKVIAQLPIGEGCDGLVFDEINRLAISSNGEGTLTVVKENSADSYVVAETLPSQRGARTLAIDPKNGHIFTITALYGEPPAATTDNPNPRRPVQPGTFMILEYGK